MKSINYRIFFSAVMIVFSINAQAQSSLGLGVSLNGTGWSGDNGAGNTTFESDNGGQLGFSLSYSHERWYAGVSLQSGEYEFTKTAPTQFTSSGATPTQGVKLDHKDFDLLLGYYVWDRVSLFVDLKAADAQWQNDGYEQGYGGLGLGVAGYKPLNAGWTLYGSWGLVGGRVSEKSGLGIGDVTSTAFTIGANYRLNPLDRLNMGLKLRSFRYDFDNGQAQQNDLAGIFFGYNHVFEW